MKVVLKFYGREHPKHPCTKGKYVNGLPFRKGKAIDLKDAPSAIELMSITMDVESVKVETLKNE